MFRNNLSNTSKDTRFNLGQKVNPNLVFVVNDRVDDIVPASLDLAQLISLLDRSLDVFLVNRLA